MNGYRADLDALDALIDRLTAFDQRATGIAADLDDEARRLAGEWGGTAATEHAQAHARWQSAHDRLRAAAEGLATFVRAAHTNYAAAADANARMWS